MHGNDHHQAIWPNAFHLNVLGQQACHCRKPPNSHFFEMSRLAEDSVWKVVKHKKKKRQRSRQRLKLSSEIETAENSSSLGPGLYGSNTLEESDIDTILNKIKSMVKEIETAEFGQSLKSILMKIIDGKSAQYSLEKNVASDPTYVVVAYGLGSFCSNNAILQMACLLYLSKLLSNNVNVGNEATATTNIFDSTYLQVHVDVYDPVMSEIDRKIIARLHCTPLSKNEECRRVVKTNCLCYVPHGSFPMYRNLLQVNYENKTLKNVILFGNSLSSYVTHVSMFNSRSVDNDTKSFIATFSSSIMPYMNEYVIHRNKMASTVIDGVSDERRSEEGTDAISNRYIKDYEVALDGKMERAFNDSSFHSF